MCGQFFLVLIIIAGLSIMLVPSGISGFFEPQTVRVRGKAVCAIPYGPKVNNTYIVHPAANATITLMEGDIFRDDELATTHSDEDGMFEIVGEQYEPNYLSPIVQLAHNCGGNEPLSFRCLFVEKYPIRHSALVDPETGLRSEAGPDIDFTIFTDLAEVKCGGDH